MKNKRGFLTVIVLACILIGCSKRRGIETDLERVNESTTFFSYFIPLHVKLMPEPMEKFLTLPPLQSPTPLFANLIAGNGLDSVITIIVDELPDGESRIFVDMNNNENLSDDTDGNWMEESPDMLRMRLVLQVEYMISGRRVLKPYGMEFFRFKNRMRDVILVSRLGYSIGTITLDGLKYTMAVSDDNCDAFYDIGHTTLIIDRDRDGQLDGSLSSAEFFRPMEPFHLRGKSYQMISVSPAGEQVVIGPSDFAVEPKAYLGPNFPAIPISEKGLDGSNISLDDFKGKILLLDFWATWCEPCRVELPLVQSVYEDFHDRGFEILGISLDEDEDLLRTFLDENNMPWPQIFDGLGWNNHVAQKYRVMAIPTTYLLDRQGIIRYRNPRGQELRERVQGLIQDQSDP